MLRVSCQSSSFPRGELEERFKGDPGENLAINDMVASV